MKEDIKLCPYESRTSSRKREKENTELRVDAERYGMNIPRRVIIIAKIINHTLG